MASAGFVGPRNKSNTQKYKIMENSFSHSNQSGKRGVGFAFLLAAFLGSCVTTELRAQVIVVPNALATNDGNSSSTTPSGGPTSVREMQIFDASQFGALSGPSFLTQFAWRPDTIPGPSGPRSVDSADLRLDDEPLRRRAEHDLRREPRHEQHARF